ncbi:hypothetical protein J6590_047392 [Homalodisca vitripennis]|nr:hypothetical protein J6590_047392 [Homalodisca vitripennis]
MPCIGPVADVSPRVRPVIYANKSGLVADRRGTQCSILSLLKDTPDDVTFDWFRCDGTYSRLEITTGQLKITPKRPPVVGRRTSPPIPPGYSLLDTHKGILGVDDIHCLLVTAPLAASSHRVQLLMVTAGGVGANNRVAVTPPRHN